MTLDSNPVNSGSRPSLIFIETTVACDYRCRHCRASSQENPLPDQLSYEQITNAIKGILEFGKPYPMVIFTGGNMLMRDRIRDIIDFTHKLGIPFSVSPSASPLLTRDFLRYIRNRGVKSLSLSLDGDYGGSHDWLRRSPGSHSLTVALISDVMEAGIPVQVNTTIMKRNLTELPYIAKFLVDCGVKTWELFFLIKTGRGLYEEDLTADQIEDVNFWLASLEKYGLTVRTVESPVFKRIKIQMAEGIAPPDTDLYKYLSSETANIFGSHHELSESSKTHRPSHPAGQGILFISQNGDVAPSGFLPLSCGNVKQTSIAQIFRENELINDLRTREKLKGKCGECKFKVLYGGSRARAFAYYDDPLAEDPGCVYQPSPTDLTYISGSQV